MKSDVRIDQCHEAADRIPERHRHRGPVVTRDPREQCDALRIGGAGLPAQRQATRRENPMLSKVSDR